MFDLSVIGEKRLQRKLASMEKRVAHKVVKDSLREAMEPVKDLAKRRAPADRGLMRRSIRTAARANKRGATALVRTGTRKQLKIPADSRYYYPAAIEYGTRTQPARSFLRAALGRLKNAVLRSVGDKIRRRLEST